MHMTVRSSPLFLGVQNGIQTWRTENSLWQKRTETAPIRKIRISSCPYPQESLQRVSFQTFFFWKSHNITRGSWPRSTRTFWLVSNSYSVPQRYPMTKSLWTSSILCMKHQLPVGSQCWLSVGAAAIAWKRHSLASLTEEMSYILFTTSSM